MYLSCFRGPNNKLLTSCGLLEPYWGISLLVAFVQTSLLCSVPLQPGANISQSGPRVLLLRHCQYMSLRSIFHQISGTECFSCQSTISWDHCNTHKVKRTCPFRFEHCATFSKETPDSKQNSNITKIFVKDCALGSECSKPGSHCNEQSSITEPCSYECCHGYLCNGATNSMASPNGSLAFLFAIVFAIIFSSQTSEARQKRKTCEI